MIKDRQNMSIRYNTIAEELGAVILVFCNNIRIILITTKLCKKLVVVIILFLNLTEVGQASRLPW